MKRKLLLFGLAITAANLLNLSYSQAQSAKFTDGMSVKLGGGLTSFYGELGAPGLSSMKYAKAGFAGSVIKMINPKFGIQVQYTAGNIYSYKSDISQHFSGFIKETSISARLELMPLLAPSSMSRFGPYLRAGLASTSFRSVRRDFATNTIYLPAYGYQNDGLTKVGSERALAIPLAAGVAYQLTDNIALEFEQSLSISNSDILDALPGTAKFNDMVGFTQVGLKYTINPLKKGLSNQVSKPARTKNKKNKRTGGQSTPTNNDISFAETNAFVESTIPDKPISGKVFEVQIRINKGDYEGPGILTQAYPLGFTAIESVMSNSQFSFVNQKVRVIWDKMPKDSIITYSYMVRPGESTRGSYAVNGNFEYRQATGPQVIHFANYIDVSNRIESGMDNRILSILDQDKINTDDQKKVVEEANKEKDLNIEELLREYGGTVKQEEVAVNLDNSEAGQIEQHQVKQGVEYRIQIGAFKNRDQGKSIVRRYSLPETVIEELHAGLYKYTLGSFNTYKDAADYRDQFMRRSQIWSAFIVGYKDGVRLSHINEAIK